MTRQGRTPAEPVWGQQYLDLTQTLMVALDAEGCVVMLNRAGRKLLGYAEDEILGRNWFETCLPQPEGGQVALPAHLRSMAGELAAVESFESEVVSRDGTRRLISWHTAEMRDETGRIVGALKSGEDITERKRAEEELIQLKKSESLGRMAGAVAHLYNNLMGAVLGNLELAADSDLGPGKAEKLMAEARAAAQRAADMSRLMLVYLGQSVGTRKPLDLAEACREALAAIAPQLPAKVRLETGLTHTPGPAVKANAAQLRQVLEALLTNAAEALGETGGAITVIVGESSTSDLPAGRMAPSDWKPAAGPYACLSVSDTGPGIAPETLERAFDPFFSTRFVGRGLGLPTVLGIVKAHGGAVFVESRPGAGATVRVLLPLTDEELPERLQPFPGALPASAAGQGLVLVVEDEPALRSLAQGMLRSLGFEAVVAPNGAEAVEIFRQRPQEIRCVLCDLTMPRMSGWETLAALRRIRADVPVVLCSGYDEASVMAGARGELPQAFLGKPYERAALSGALAMALHRQDIDAQLRDAPGRTGDPMKGGPRDQPEA